MRGKSGEKRNQQLKICLNCLHQKKMVNFTLYCIVQTKFHFMKKLIILASLALFLFAGKSYAGEPSLFTYDKSVLETEMASLNDLEDFVLNNPGITLSGMLAKENPLASSVAGTNNFTSLNLLSEEAFGIGGFWWGCCLGPAGVLVVYLVSEDKAETRSSIIGCVVGSLLYSGSWAAYAWGLNGGNYYW